MKLSCPPQERDERAQPVAGGGEDDVAGAGRGELAGDVASLGRGGVGEAVAELLAAGVDAELSAGLGVDEPELAGVRQLLLARVADLDRDDVVAAGELEQRPAPVARPAEVGDDDDERALAGERVGPAERVAERGRAEPAGRRLGLVAERGEQADEAEPALAHGQRAAGPAPPKVSAPSRLPRRVARWPTAIATPSATSAFRRSAVPKRIDGEVSSTSQVTSTRSARWTRTCGSPVRAVTFQSIRRTSSPGT